MAVVTINTTFRPNVIGHLRQFNYNVDIAADADHLDVPVKNLNYASVIANNNAAIGYTASLVSGRTRLTFQTGGAETGVHVSAAGN